MIKQMHHHSYAIVTVDASECFIIFIMKAIIICTAIRKIVVIKKVAFFLMNFSKHVSLELFINWCIIIHNSVDCEFLNLIDAQLFAEKKKGAA